MRYGLFSSQNVDVFFCFALFCLHVCLFECMCHRKIARIRSEIFFGCGFVCSPNQILTFRRACNDADCIALAERCDANKYANTNERTQTFGRRGPCLCHHKNDNNTPNTECTHFRTMCGSFGRVRLRFLWRQTDYDDDDADGPLNRGDRSNAARHNQLYSGDVVRLHCQIMITHTWAACCGILLGCDVFVRGTIYLINWIACA